MKSHHKHINSTTPSSQIQKMRETLTVHKVKAKTVIDSLHISPCKKTTSKTHNTPSRTLSSEDVPTKKSHAYSHQEKFNPHEITTC